jgi:hypothetical protein
MHSIAVRAGTRAVSPQREIAHCYPGKTALVTGGSRGIGAAIAPASPDVNPRRENGEILAAA